MKKTLVLFLLYSIYSNSYSQKKACTTQEVFNQRLGSVSGLREIVDRYLAALRTRIENYPINPQLHRNPLIIPVVVHVVYNNATQNITDEQINSQIDALNRAFRKRNTTEIATNPSTTYKGRTSDCLIEFRLAKRKPDGTATTGITRRSTTTTAFNDRTNDVKLAANGVVPWDASKYLNIWVCKLREIAPGSALMGYAAFPWDNNPALDGVVIDYHYFGTTGTVTAPNHQGKTTVHEVAHYLGLWHIWGDNGEFPPGCAVDDEVTDTPLQMDSNGGCPTYPTISCSAGGAEGDMFMNYMDYVNDQCMNMFSTGQRARMLANFAPGEKRASLALSNGLIPPHSTNIDYEVFLIPQLEGLPSWKAAMGMVWATARQQSPDIPGLETASGPFAINGLPNDVATTINALVLNYQEILVCYSVEGFRTLLRRGPIAILSIGGGNKYGIVVSGMSIDANGNALLKIKDPMSVGPQFGITQTGAEYQVEYATFMTQNLEQLARDNKKMLIIYPPSSGGL